MNDVNFNAKAQIFKNYLEEQKIEAFQADAIDDELKTNVFRSHIIASGQNLDTLVILDNSMYGILRVVIGTQVVNDENRNSVIAFLNELNMKFKVFKYYVADDGTIVLDSCILLNDEQPNGELIYAVISVVVNHLQEFYPQVMAKVWGK